MANFIENTKKSLLATFYPSVNQDYKDTVAEIKRNPDNPIVPNRYANTYETQAYDGGIYGYSTRSEVLQNTDFATAERCFRDPRVRSSLRILLNDVFQDNLRFVARNSSPEAQESKEFIDHLYNEMEGAMEVSLKEALQVGLFFGTSFGELIPQPCNSGSAFAGKTILRKIRSIRTGLLEYDLDMYDEICSIHSLVELNLYFPKERFLLVTPDKLWNNDYGNPLFDSVYKYWKGKDIVYRQMLVYSNRYSQPIPKVEYSDPQYKEIADTICKNLYAGASLSVPTGVIIDFVQASESGNDPFQVFLNYFDEQISLAILGDPLTKGSGSFAADKVKKDERGTLSAELRRMVLETVNEQIIRRFMEWNFPKDTHPSSVYPKVIFQKTNRMDKGDFIKAVEVADRIGAMDIQTRVSDLEYVRKEMDYPELTETEKEEMQEMAELKGEMLRDRDIIDEEVGDEPDPQEPTQEEYALKRLKFGY